MGATMAHYRMCTAMYDARKKFRRIRDYAAIPALVAAIDKRGLVATIAAAT